LLILLIFVTLLRKVMIMQAMISIKHADERFPHEHDGAAAIQWMGCHVDIEYN